MCAFPITRSDNNREQTEEDIDSQLWKYGFCESLSSYRSGKYCSISEYNRCRASSNRNGQKNRKIGIRALKK